MATQGIRKGAGSIYLGDWIRQRRDYLRLTRDELAQRAGCSAVMIKKVEDGDRRVSDQLAPRLAHALALPESVQIIFVNAARGDSVQRLLAYDSMQDFGPGKQTQTRDLANRVPFVGRRTEKIRLLDALNGSIQRRVALVGMPGVGKTTLARHIAHLSPEWFFPDGVLWAHIGSQSTFSIIDQFARQLNPQASLASTQRERIRQLRQLLEGRQMLIVFDNVEADDESALEELIDIQPAGCAVIATSRVVMDTFTHWEVVMLNAFESNSGESLNLFRLMLGDTFTWTHNGLLTQLADRVGQLPLALSLTAAHINHQRDPARFIHKWITSDGWNAMPDGMLAIQTAFDSSYAGLTAQQRHIFNWLGLFSGLGATVEACACIAACTSATAERALRNLVMRSLVQITPEGRHQLHPLLLGYARQKLTVVLTETAWSEAYCRLLRYYVAIAQEGEESYSRLDFEIDNIAWCLDASIRHAGGQNGPQSELAVVYVATVRALFSYFYRRGRKDLTARHLAQALSLAEVLADADDQAQLTYWMAQMTLNDNRVQAAIAAYVKALSYADIAKNVPRQIDVLCGMGWAHLIAHQHADAQAYLQRAYDLSRQIDYRGDEKDLLDGLHILATKLENAEAARRYAQELVDYGRSAGDDYALHSGLHNLGNVAFYNGDISEAETLYRESIQIQRNIHHVRELGWGSVHLIRLLLKSGRCEEAEPLIEEALANAMAQGISPLDSYLLNYKGYLCYLRSDYALAESTLEESIERLQSLTDPDMFALSQAHQYLHLIAKATGRIALADRCCDAGLKFARASNQPMSLIIALHAACLHCLDLGDPAQAHVYLKMMQALGCADGELHVQLLLHVALACFSENRGEIDTAKVSYAHAIDIATRLQDWVVACELHYKLSQLLTRLAELVPAQSHLEASMQLADKMNSPEFIARAQWGAAQIARSAGHHTEAQRFAETSLSSYRRMGHVMVHQISQWLSHTLNVD